MFLLLPVGQEQAVPDTDAEGQNYEGEYRHIVSSDELDEEQVAYD